MYRLNVYHEMIDINMHMDVSCTFHVCYLTMHIINMLILMYIHCIYIYTHVLHIIHILM